MSEKRWEKKNKKAKQIESPVNYGVCIISLWIYILFFIHFYVYVFGFKTYRLIRGAGQVDLLFLIK